MYFQFVNFSGGDRTFFSQQISEVGTLGLSKRYFYSYIKSKIQNRYGCNS
jgi:hypothetical protein